MEENFRAHKKIFPCGRKNIYTRTEKKLRTYRKKIVYVQKKFLYVQKNIFVRTKIRLLSRGSFQSRFTD